MSDIEIARKARLLPISQIGEKLSIPEENLIRYGSNKAKISNNHLESIAGNQNGKLILVTAITPTPAGEGKTTTSVGLNDGLNKLGKSLSCVCENQALGLALE